MAFKDVVNELYRSRRKNFIRRPTVLKGIDDLICFDLAEMGNLQEANSGIRFLLCGINGFTKMGYIRPIPTKQGLIVTKATEDILDESSESFKNCQTDQG